MTLVSASVPTIITDPTACIGQKAVLISVTSALDPTQEIACAANQVPIATLMAYANVQVSGLVLSARLTHLIAIIAAIFVMDQVTSIVQNVLITPAAIARVLVNVRTTGVDLDVRFGLGSALRTVRDALDL